MVQAWHSLEDWAAPEVSPDFDRKLYARLEQEEAIPVWRRMFSFSWKTALPLSAACAALGIALLIHAPEPAVTPDPAMKAKAEMVSMDQVEEALEDLDLLAPADL